MGGKGRRRREKNYQEAHGGGDQLPPPPKAKEVEAIPAKLRLLINLQNNPSPTNPNKRNGDGLKDGKEKFKLKAGRERQKDQKDVQCNLKSKVNLTEPNNKKQEHDVGSEKKKKKKRKKTVNDLRFEDLANGGQTKRKRRKEFLDARKKKNKKPKTDDIREFPGREDIKFGEIVYAPPKFSKVPKAFSSHDPSQERLRLKAIEDYRNRRGWDSRPGMNLFAKEVPS